MWDPKRITLHEPANIYLLRAGVLQVVVAIATHEMPLIAEVVVDARHPEIRSLRDRQVGGETQDINSVAPAEPAPAGFVRQRHVLIPELLDHRIDADAPRVAGTSRTLSWSIGHPVVRHGKRVQVVSDATKGQQPQTHCRRRNCPLNGSGVGAKAEAFVVAEEIRLATQNLLGNDGAADRPAETVEVETGDRRTGEVVLPGIRV